MKKRGMNHISYDYETAYNKSIEDLNEFFIQYMLANRYKRVYACKEIRAGEQLEIEIYPEFKSMDDVPPSGRDNSKAQHNLNNKNSIKYCQRMIAENFTDNDLWMTVTYRPGQEPENEDEADRNTYNYIRRLNYKCKKKGLHNLKWLVITEYDPEAKVRWHHHIILEGILDRDVVELAWKLGDRNQTKRIEKDENGLIGMAKYITKQKNRPKFKKRWHSSKGLKQFRVRKVYNKKKGGKGSYAPVSRYIDEFVRDRYKRESQLKAWYPDFYFLESNVYFNDFNGSFYINARMVRKE